MPCTAQAVDILRTAKVVVAPAKATAAGGVMQMFLSILLWSKLHNPR